MGSYVQFLTLPNIVEFHFQTEQMENGALH